MNFEEPSESSAPPKTRSKWEQIIPKVGVSPYERSNHTCVVVDNNLYVYGGHDSTGNSLNDLLVYNEKLGWSYASVNKITQTINKTIVVKQGFSYHPQAPLELSPIPQGRACHTAVVYKNNNNNKFMIVVGGNATEIRGQVYFLDFSPNARLTWCVFIAPNAPPEVLTQRFHHTAVIWKNKMVLYGGTNGDTPLPACLIFLDLEKFKWKVKKSPNFKQTYCHAAFVKDNLMYIVGGCNPDSPNGFSVYSLDTYQALSSENYIPKSLTVNRRLLTATIIDRFLYLIGGYIVTPDGIENGCVNQVDIIDLVSKNYTPIYPSMTNRISPEPLCGHTAVEYNGKILIFGGCDRLPLLDGRWVFYGFTSDMWQFTPPTMQEFEILRKDE